MIARWKEFWADFLAHFRGEKPAAAEEGQRPPDRWRPLGIWSGPTSWSGAPGRPSSPPPRGQAPDQLDRRPTVRFHPRVEGEVDRQAQAGREEHADRLVGDARKRWLEEARRGPH